MSTIVESYVDKIVDELKKKLFIEVEASGRHVHLSKKDLNTLFGEGYQLTKAKDLSQPGQFACNERVTISGPKGAIKNVIILGPERKDTQVEVSLTDALALGIKPPIRLSGDVEDSPGVVIINGDRKVEINQGIIVAKRHIHMLPEDAQRLGVEDKEVVKIKVFGLRPLIFDDVVVRVNKNFRTFVHIDYDEANACGYKKGTFAFILK